MDKEDDNVPMNSDSEVEIEPMLSNWIQVNSRFEDMKLKSGLLNVVSREYEKPLPLQSKTIFPCCLGRDILIAAPAGTGKTSSAIISVLNTVTFVLKQCQAVFLLPNSDSACQVEKMISNFFNGEKIEKHVCNVCTKNAYEQKCFTEGVQIIIGTPETLLTLFSADTYVKDYAVRTVVLDEAFSVGSIEPINSLIQRYLDWSAQLILLCTTVSKEIREFTTENMADPIRIIVENVNELPILEENDVHKNSEAFPMEIDTIPATEVTSEDEFDLLSKQVAVKLRNLPQYELTKIKKLIDLILFDTLPKYCVIDKLIASTLPNSKKCQCTQTENTEFCVEEYDVFKSKLIDTPLISQVSPFNVITYTTVKWIRHFEDASLKRQIKNGVLYDYKVPLLLQQKCLKLLLNGYDMLIQSPEGSGKTTAIIIHALNITDTNVNEVQAVIVVPDLDLVYKTRDNIIAVSQFVENFKCRPICNLIELKNHVNSGAHVLVTVPEFVTSINLNTNHLKLFAVEHVDELFLDSFDKLISEFMNQLPPKCQIVLSGNQCNSPSIRLIHRYLLRVNVTPENLLLHGVKQFSMRVRNENRKYNNLNEVIKKFTTHPIVIFCNTIFEVTTLTKRLLDDGVVSAVSLIEKLDEQNFDAFHKKFMQKEKKIIITWDHCAQIINLEYVPLVVNYVMPFRRENFIQRIRRSGKYKQKSVVINFVTTEEAELLTDIVNEYDIICQAVVEWTDIDFENHTK